ncbi:MAG: hypothetical protein ACLP7Q_10240 [Isosphaeraceae bacterium]
MIIVGKGSDLKKIGFAGIEKCPNCKNYVPLWLCEHSHKLTAYFIAVVRYKRQLLYLCETCNQAFLLKEGTEEEAIKSTVSLPSREEAVAMWSKLYDRLADAVRREQGRPNEEVVQVIHTTMMSTIAELKQSYQPMHVDYVHSRFVQFLEDSDCPR